jgi:hypothetical protein
MIQFHSCTRSFGLNMKKLGSRANVSEPIGSHVWAVSSFRRLYISFSLLLYGSQPKKTSGCALDSFKKAFVNQAFSWACLPYPVLYNFAWNSMLCTIWFGLRVICMIALPCSFFQWFGSRIVCMLALPYSIFQSIQFFYYLPPQFTAEPCCKLSIFVTILSKKDAWCG